MDMTVREVRAELQGLLRAHADGNPPPRWVRGYCHTHSDERVRAECHVVLAVATSREGPYELAHWHLDQAEELYGRFECDDLGVPARFSSLATRGFVTMHGRDALSTAQDCYARATQFARDHDYVYGVQLGLLNLGWISMKRGDPTAAILRLVEVITSPAPERRPYVHARRALAMTLAARGDLRDAMHHSQAAVYAADETMPRDRAQALCDLGELRARNDDGEGAERALIEAESAAGANPDFVIRAALGMLRARIHLRQGDTSTAKRDLAPLAAMNPYHSYAIAIPLLLQMEVALAEGSPRQAIALGEHRVDHLSPHQRPQLWALLATAHAELDNWDIALEYLRKCQAGRLQFEFQPHEVLRLSNVPHSSLSEEAAQLRNQHETISELARQNDQLLDLVAHELNGPLGNIRMALDLAAEDPDAVSRHLNSAWHGLRRMRRTTSSMRAARNVRSEVSVGELAPVDLASVARDLVDEFSSMAQRKSISIDHDPHGSVMAYASNQHVEICVANLISNALKFSNSATSVSIAVEECDSTVRLLVEDQGPGLTDADLDGLFSSGVSLSAQPTAGESSSGLGLFISQEVATAMGGRVRVERLATGTLFILELRRYMSCEH